MAMDARRDARIWVREVALSLRRLKYVALSVGGLAPRPASRKLLLTKCADAFSR